MKTLLFTIITLLMFSATVAANSLSSLSELNSRAKERTNAVARVKLIEGEADIFKDLEMAEPKLTPNYLRALGNLPKTVKPFDKLVKTTLYGGTLAPETKLAMGLRIAQKAHSSYVATHLQRLLRSSDKGEKLLQQLLLGKLDELSVAEQLAIEFAENLTADIAAIKDEDFKKIRQYYNDSQIVELTLVVCFFNYFDRLCEGLNLPVEQWALDNPVAKVGVEKREDYAARVGLISDEEIEAVGKVVTASKEQTAGSLGLGVANSQRAMLRVPDIAMSWRNYWSAVREYSSVSREIKLQVSFAVSMANGCRYCTLHQVLGLRKLGVPIAKLVAMKKDDSSLNEQELAAVEFARKLTKDVTSITDEDFVKLQGKFSEIGAIEVVLQTCAFNFMNRFTDNLRLPSEDEAVKIYKETYGRNFE